MLIVVKLGTVCYDVKFEKELGPQLRATQPVELRTPRQHYNAQLASADSRTMAPKTYKEMKEAWVTGHTGSSVADVNSVALAMPVPYTHCFSLWRF